MLTILIVDDHPSHVETLCLALEQLGYQPLKMDASHDCSSPTVNLNQPVDILIADHDMRNRMGYELLDELKKSNPELKSILVSGCYECSLDGKGVFDEVLLKPVDLDVLERILHKWNNETQN
jgi:response regulator RpfG family c-di-GMP phosphodiesterase